MDLAGGLGRTRPAAGVRGNHRRAATAWFGWEHDTVCSTCAPGKRSSPRQASGSATARRRPDGAEYVAICLPAFRRTPCIGTNRYDKHLACAAGHSDRRIVRCDLARSAAHRSTAKDRLVGAWGLVSFVSFDANGASRPGAYDLGRIVYDASGQMSAHLMHSSNKADASPATDADRSAAFRRYLGYYGPFTVDELTGHRHSPRARVVEPELVGSNQCGTSRCRKMATG
jgi:hypothetical protein